MSQEAVANLIDQEKLEFAVRMFKLLGNELRFRLVEILDLEGEKTVTQLTELTGQPQPTVSLYLNRLKNLGLLTSRREGIQIYYSVAEPKLRTLLNCLRDCPFE